MENILYHCLSCFIILNKLCFQITDVTDSSKYFLKLPVGEKCLETMKPAPRSFESKTNWGTVFSLSLKIEAAKGFAWNTAVIVPCFLESKDSFKINSYFDFISQTPFCIWILVMNFIEVQGRPYHLRKTRENIMWIGYRWAHSLLNVRRYRFQEQGGTGVPMMRRLGSPQHDCRLLRLKSQSIEAVRAPVQAPVLERISPKEQ